MKKILVAGATGRIGRAVIAEFVASEESVRALTHDLARAELPATAGHARLERAVLVGHGG